MVKRPGCLMRISDGYTVFLLLPPVKPCKKYKMVDGKSSNMKEQAHYRIRTAIRFNY